MDKLQEQLNQLDFEEFEQQFTAYIEVAKERCDSCDYGSCFSCQVNCNYCPCKDCGLYFVRLNSLVAQKLNETKSIDINAC